MRWKWHTTTQQWTPQQTLPNVPGWAVGWSVFTTFRWPVAPIWVKAHGQRVLQHAHQAELQSEPELADALLALLSAQFPSSRQNYRVRVTAVAGQVPVQPSLLLAKRPLETVWLVEAAEWPTFLPEQAPAPQRCLLPCAYQPADPTIKWGTLAPALRLRHHAIQTAEQEVLWLDEQGRATECTTANVFWLLANGDLVTAPHHQVLSGIARRQVLMVAQSLGWRVQLQAPTVPTILANAVGGWTSNSVEGLVPVAQVAGVALPWPLEARVRWETCYSRWLAVWQQGIQALASS